MGAREALTAGFAALAACFACSLPAVAATPADLPSGIPAAAKRAEPVLPAPPAWLFGEGLTIPVTSEDGSLELTLLGLEPGQRVSLDGAPAGRAGRRGGVSLLVPAGGHVVNVSG